METSRSNTVKKESKQADCKTKAANFKGGIVELNEFLVCGDCDYLCQCFVPQYLMESRDD